MRARHHLGSENVPLDRIDFEKLKDHAKAERAEYLRQYGMTAIGVLCTTLRAHHVMAVVAILIISFGAKMFFWSAPTAEADTRRVPSVSMNIRQIQTNHPNGNNLPPQHINNMTFVEPLP